MIPEEIVFNFAASQISSVWTLDLLLVLKQSARALTPDELIRMLRASEAAVSEALARLVSAGLVIKANESYRYAPASEAHSAIVAELERLYREKPVAVISAIANAPNRKLQILSDAFKLKKG